MGNAFSLTLTTKLKWETTFPKFHYGEISNVFLLYFWSNYKLHLLCLVKVQFSPLIFYHVNSVI